MRHHAKFIEDRSRHSGDMVIFDFARWRPPPYWIFYISNFELSERSRGSIWVILRNFIEIGQTTAEIWLFFHVLRWQLSAILDFYKCKILTSGPVQRPNTSRRAEFRKHRSNHSGDMVIFRFFKMAAVRHIGFVVGTLGPPTKSTWWSLSLC